jgi:hypothetical protein
LEWCRIARGSGQPGDFDVPVIVVFAAPDRAAWRRPIGIGIGAIVVHGFAPTAHNITAHCPPAHDEDSDALAGISPPGRDPLGVRLLPPLLYDRRAIMIAAVLTLMAMTAVLAVEIGWLMSDPVFRGK